MVYHIVFLFVGKSDSTKLKAKDANITTLKSIPPSINIPAKIANTHSEMNIVEYGVESEDD
jgi:hypothetical protein